MPLALKTFRVLNPTRVCRLLLVFLCLWPSVSIAQDSDAFSRFIAQYPDSRLSAYINSLALSLIQNNDLAISAPRIYLADYDDANAMAYPGNRIVVTRGLLALLNDESELACVIAHELAHLQERHIEQERAEYERALELAEKFQQRFKSEQARDLAMTFSYAIKQGYSREQEREADRLALRYLVEGGYDTTAAVRVMSKLQSYKAFLQAHVLQVSNSEMQHPIYDTHPGADDRLEHLRESMQELGYIEQRQPRTGLYHDLVDGLPLIRINQAELTIEIEQASSRPQFERYFESYSDEKALQTLFLIINGLQRTDEMKFPGTYKYIYPADPR